jgi:hypothetical protein
MTPPTSAPAPTVVESARPLRLEGRIERVTALDDRTRDAMFRLLAGHFIGVDRETFETDLAAKTCAILLEDDDGELRGFSTMVLYRTLAAGTSRTIVYSGDTIVHRDWWGSASLARTWVKAVRLLAAEDGRGELFWFLLTSGFRTYRFLPVFFRDFHPRFDEPAPDATAAFLAAIARERFGDQYDAATGVVRFTRPQVLAPELLDLPDGRTMDPHVAFFLARNPGHVRGDELACLTRIHDDNLTPAGRRMARPEPSR